MKLVKKLLALMLIAAALCAFLVPGAAAADTDAEKIRAVVATALAYNDKGFLYQYGAKELTVQNRVSGGVCRLTTMRQPEYAAPDDLGYTVCSDFTFCCYYNALGYALYGSPRKAITANQSKEPADSMLTVLKYGGGDGMDDIVAATEKARTVLQPGDIVTYTTKTGAGHAMLYAGDCLGDGKKYIIHSGGSSYDPETGVDSIEDRGSVRMEDVEESLFDARAWMSFLQADNARWTILRPMNDPAMKDCQILPSARIRMQYPRMTVTRTVDPTQYASVRTGEAVTVTTEIRNGSKTDYKGLTLSDPLPTGARIVSGSLKHGGKMDGSSITWTVDVPAGKTVALSYTAQVTAARGENVYFPMNHVDGKMPVRDITLRVDGQPFSSIIQERLQLISRMSGRFSTEEWKSLSQGRFVNYFFEKFTGAQLDLPDTIGELQRGLFSYVPATHMPDSDGKMWKLKERSQVPEPLQYLYDMLIREHTIGQMVCTEEDPMTPPYTIGVSNRVRTFQEQNYQPGDIFMGYSRPDLKKCTEDKNSFVYIYLGNGRVAAQNSDTGISIMKFEESIQLCHKDSFCVALRPSQAFDDVNTAKARAVTFSDVPAGAWYADYLRSLYRSGIISGMTETSFAPNGNLTCGQALKLVVKGMGFDDQPPVEGGHWASGYEKLAREQQWLKGEIQLDADISRLNFCQIASRAGNLARKSPADTFADCRDVYVLRLHKAGIIYGVAEKTFAPDAPLTRAQITKIIYLLNQV